MKRSKLFLGLTTGLLAVAGVAAARAHYNGVAANVKTRSTLQCVAASSQNDATLTAPSINPQKLHTSSGYTLYTATTGITCTHPLYHGTK